MKTLRTFGIILLALHFLGCAKKVADEIGYGEINDQTYSNRYLGFSIVLPDDWSLQSADANAALMEMGTDLVSGTDANLKAQMKASELQSVTLFSLMKYEVGSPVDSNPSIIAVAERIKHMPGIKKGADYHFHTKKLLEQSQMSVAYPKEIYESSIGGFAFDTLETEMTFGATTVRQQYHAAIVKDYALVIILTYTEDGELDELEAILETTEVL